MKYRLQLNTDTQMFTVIDSNTRKTAEGITIQAAIKQIEK